MIDTATLLFALAALGSQWGYQPVEDGTMEYLIQLRPQEAQHLASTSGVEITSYVPDEAQPVGRIRIFVGDAALPQGSRPEESQTADGAALALTDSRGEAVAVGQDAPIRETQARVARPGADGTSASDAHRYDEPSDLDKDLAGRLVAIPAEPEPQQIAQRQGVDPPIPQGGAADEAENSNPPEPKVAATLPSEGEEAAAADAQASRVADHITNPVYRAERPDPVEAEVKLPEFGSLGPNEAAGRREVSPSDSPADANDSPHDDRENRVPEDDRPWLPLAGAVAAACGFLAGNVFQWRSYLSLRKRYLNLLRTTGG